MGIQWGHQEVDRIIDEVEQIFACQPTEWLVLEPIGSMIMHQWYEDEDEFEDAIGGSFEEFMRAIPHIDLRVNDRGSTEFRVVPPDPGAVGRILTLRVMNREDLWRVLFKAPDASIRIPHIEFESGQHSKRQIESIYNHIAAAVFNLSSHVRQNADHIDDNTTQCIAETIDELNKLLDVDEPFTVIVHDPTATSLFKPDDGVVVETMLDSLSMAEDAD